MPQTASLGVGFLTRRALVDRYEERTGWEFADHLFYRALGVFKLAALGEMFFRRDLKNNADDPLYTLMREGEHEIFSRAIWMIDGDKPL